MKGEKGAKDVGHFRTVDFFACPSKTVLKSDASGKKGMLSCCESFSE